MLRFHYILLLKVNTNRDAMLIRAEIEKSDEISFYAMMPS
jgi:hypothetical protein